MRNIVFLDPSMCIPINYYSSMSITDNSRVPCLQHMYHVYTVYTQPREPTAYIIVYVKITFRI